MELFTCTLHAGGTDHFTESCIPVMHFKLPMHVSQCSVVNLSVCGAGEAFPDLNHIPNHSETHRNQVFDITALTSFDRVTVRDYESMVERSVNRGLILSVLRGRCCDPHRICLCQNNDFICPQFCSTTFQDSEWRNNH